MGRMPDPLRVAQVAPIAEPVAPGVTSAVEHLVGLLTGELVARGHDVTLFATGDSETPARLSSLYPQSYKKDWRMWDNWQYHELMHLASAFEHAEEFDVIHSHVYHFAPALACLVNTPALHTDHIPQGEDVRALYARHNEARIVALSRHHRGRFWGLNDVPIVYNGVDTGSFPYNDVGGDYLLFLGHMIERKGPLQAIETARKAGMRLVMAGDARDDHFEAEVKPLVDGKGVEYVGPVGIEARNELLAGAGALLFTSLFSEPFGLVMVEAMACGTPVAALDRCAVPEIVDRGATGYYADDSDSLAAVIPDVLALDRAHVREQVRKRFDHRRMTDEYEALYKIAAGRSEGVIRWFA